MSPLRQRMIDDMKLAGLSAATHAIYINAVRGLAVHYRRSPDEVSEEEVRAYLLNMRERGAARGRFMANHYGIQFLYRSTLNRDWAPFSKKNPPAQAEAAPQCAQRCPSSRPSASPILLCQTYIRLFSG
jgi:Phage integrase, N-terminal SAM-like domain